MKEGLRFLTSMKNYLDRDDACITAREKSYHILLTLCRFNGEYFDAPCPHIMRKGSALIAELAKKDPHFAENLKTGYNLTCDVAAIGKKQLAQLIMNLDYKSLPIGE